MDNLPPTLSSALALLGCGLALMDVVMNRVQNHLIPDGEAYWKGEAERLAGDQKALASLWYRKLAYESVRSHTYGKTGVLLIIVAGLISLTM